MVLNNQSFAHMYFLIGIGFSSKRCVPSLFCIRNRLIANNKILFLNIFKYFFFQIFCKSRCGDIVGETFLSSVDSPTLMIVTMDTKFAGGRATHKGFKLHFEKEKEGALYFCISCLNMNFNRYID